MKLLFRISIVLLICLAIFGYYGYQTIWGDNTNPATKSHNLFIPKGATLQTVMDSLAINDMLTSIPAFKRTALIMQFGDASIKPGRYDISQLTTNRSIIQKLRIGDQDAIDLVINNCRTTEEFCKKIAQQLPLSVSELQTYFTSEKLLNNWEIDQANLFSRILPDTYKVYWTSTPEQIAKKLDQANTSFWNKERLEKLKHLDYTKEEVITLASIVQKESNYNPEKPRIAGVYVNRLQRGILLQADPTVVFATGKFDLRRVLNRHLAIDSPYNTYKYAGLPPGPICMPSKASIDAVLNYESHKFLYFCAKPDYSGQHDFAATLRQHNNNANRYRRWLNKQGIK